MILRYLLPLLFICTFCLAPPSMTAHAQGLRDMTIIRDVEIETALKEWAAPLIKAADLEQEAVKIILVQSDQVNAFVAGGPNIFIYTGLLEKTESPGEVIGVIAHELGHIAGGHLISNDQAMKHASYESILGTALGIGAAILTGNGRVASAIGIGAQQQAMRNYLGHSRTNESSADQAALKFLDHSHQSPEGLMTFFEKLEDQELLPASQQDEYVRTHPLTQNRIETIRNKAEKSPYLQKEWPASWNEEHRRMKAKLLAFIKPSYIAWHYSDRDQSFAARYARAIAAYRLSDITNALRAVNALIDEEPQNPYLYELKGQMLMDFSRVDEALPSLQKMVALAPNVGLFHMMLGHALLEASSEKPGQNYLKEAISHLLFALDKEPRNAQLHRLLATAYGQLGQKQEAQLHLAEEAVLQGKYPYARQLARQIIDQAPAESKIALQAQDILNYIDQIHTKE